MNTNLQRKLLILFCSLILILYLFSVYFYPRSRDEFYYLTKVYSNVFEEYANSYLSVNARIGQFFSNLSGRSMFFNLMTSPCIFFSFFYLLYLFVFKKRPQLEAASLKKMIIILGLFIFLINYFGEMFFYVPYNTNYTLINVFYLIYIFYNVNYFIYDKDYLARYKVPIWLVVLFSFFTGMGNEHVPPALIAYTGINFLILLIKNKKLIFPSKGILFSFIGLLCGYIVLFFAPANRVRFQNEGKREFGFSIADYLENIKMIIKMYYYYNLELLIFVAFMVIVGVILYLRKKIDRKLIQEISSYLFLIFLCLLITAYSPIVGTRLLFFGNVLLIVSGLIILLRNTFSSTLCSKKINFAFALVSLYVTFYFCCALLICWHAGADYNLVMKEIKARSALSKDVVIERSFDYKVDDLGSFNRKVLLDSGEDYIDKDANHNTSVEENIIDFFKINTLKSKK